MFEVIEDGEGRLVGTIGLFRVDEKTCELRKMYLDTELRGRGFGKLMLERAVNHARTSGFKKIVLETASVLEEAIRLYTRFGFQPMKRGHLAPRCDQAYFLDLSE
jgi:putative acetyltransferase